MALLPSAGIYRLKTDEAKFLYARGFSPTWRTVDRPYPRPLILRHRREHLFREIAPEEQMRFLRHHLLQPEPKPYLLVVGSVPLNTGLSFAYWVAWERVKAFGLEDPCYCVPCSLDKDEILEELESPKVLFIYQVEQDVPLARELALTFATCLRVILVATDAPLFYSLRSLKLRPDNVFLF